MNETEQQTIPTEQTQSSLPMETPAEVASGSGSRSEFLQQLPEQIRDHPSLQSINDVGNLGLSFVNAQRLIGADKLPLPKNPTEEDLSNIYSKLGRPDEPSGYALQADGQMLSDEDVNTVSDIFHKLGLSKQQANGVIDYYKSSVQQTTEAMAKESAQQKTEIEQKLKAEWGADYDAKVSQANQAVADIAGQEVLDMVLQDGTKVGNHPVFIKAFANFASFKNSVTKEDTISENAVNYRMSPADAQARIDQIMQDKNHAYWNRKDTIGRQKAVQEVQDLYEMVSGAA
jgi:hypothetical protein|tara:strand:+ start:264 stop:1124 length:861 start_codon:yes stop_codon:yes gene_type:complete